MAQALYRKYRSTSLDEILGQDHITDVMKRALQSGRISHAYLLTGPRGVGKTSIARIMAHDINKLPYTSDGHLDIIEIDAASNNGVDDVRDLREKVSITPSSLTKKIYIIDEVHMLSKPAFNALLKTLEEPPEHVVFILATTEVHKLPDTILSRTQRFHFRPISTKDMKRHLKEISKKEKIKIADDALELIGERANGSFRDAISLLDQLSNISEQEITASMVEETLGLAPSIQLDQLVAAITTHNMDGAIKILGILEEGGVSPVVLSEQLSGALKPLITSQPEFIHIIDQLIEVGRSYNPYLKLLAVVAQAASSDTEKSIPTSVNVAAATSAKFIAISPPAEKKKQENPSPPIVLKETIASQKSKPLKVDDVEWPKVLDYIRKTYPPLYGVVKNASVSTDNSTLNLHFSFGLHKKKLDEGKFRQLLLDSLNSLYKNIPDITLTHGKIAPKNSQALAVADIMGGGEEVSIA